MNKLNFTSVFTFCFLFICIFLNVNGLSAQEKSSFDELPEYRNLIGVNAGRAMPFVRGDNSLAHYMRLTDKGNFHKHTVLFDIDNYDSTRSVGDSLNMYNQHTDGTDILFGYNFAFGKRKQVHKKIVLYYGPQVGFNYSDVKRDVTFPDSTAETDRVDTGSVFQLSGGLMGGVQLLLTPRLSVYTDASYLARYTTSEFVTAGISNGGNNQVDTRLKISKNLVFFYSF